MEHNVRVLHTSHGAQIIVSYGAFQVSKSYSCMAEAARDAIHMGLISQRQHILLQGNSMSMPHGLTTHADAVESLNFFSLGFALANGAE